jgi:hypothetical protein
MLSALNFTFVDVIDTEAEPALIGVTVTVTESERPSEEYTTAVNAYTVPEDIVLEGKVSDDDVTSTVLLPSVL